MTNRRLTAAAVCASLFQLAGCGGGGGSPTPAPPSPPANAAPAFGALNFNATEDVELNARAAATDPEGATVTLSSTSAPAHGTLVSFSSATGDFVYRPSTNYFGADSFSVRAQDSAGNASTSIVNITVAAVNDAPTVTPLSLRTDEDQPVSGQVVVADIENQAIVLTRLTDPAHGSIPSFAAGGAFTYQPAHGFSGSDSFNVRATDAGGASSDISVTLNVDRPFAVYTGSTTPVVIADANAKTSARSGWMALKLVVQLSENALSAAQPTGAIDVTVNGDLAGSVHYSGTLGADGIGTLTADYAGYQSSGAPDLKLNGRELIDILDPPTVTVGRVRRVFRGLTVTSATLTGTLSGSLLRAETRFSRPPGAPTGRYSRVTGNVVVLESTGGVQRWFANIDLTSTPGFEYVRDPNVNSMSVNSWTGALRAYDSRYGAVEVSLDPSFRFLQLADYTASPNASDVTLAIGRGSLVIAGGGARRLWLTALSPDTFALETNAAGGSTPDRSVAFRWVDDFGASAGADIDLPVLAVATLPMETSWANNGSVFMPEGRFSEGAQGEFLSHQWSLLTYPPGSTAQLTNANSPRPSVTPDLTGWYLLRLTVSDGTQSSTDFVSVESLPAGQLPNFLPPLARRSIIGSNPVHAMNEEIAFDARRSYNTYYHPQFLPGVDEPFIWIVERLDTGSFPQRVLTAPPGEVLRYTPTQPGRYAASYVQPSYLSLPFMYVPIELAPTPRTTTTISHLGHIPIDWDNDGDLDLVAHRGGINNPNNYQVVRRNAAGRFDAPQLLSPVDFEFSQFQHQFDDVNGDGRPDLVRRGNYPPPYSTQISLQQPNGALGAPITLGDGANFCGDPFWLDFRYIGAIDIDRDGDLDIFRVGHCFQGPNINVGFALMNLSNGNGTYADATMITAPANLSSGIAADIDGDGDREIIGVPVPPSGLPDNLALWSVNNSGGFTATSVLLTGTYAPYGIDVRAVDINGDGRRDLIAGSGNTFVLTQNADHSFTERASIPGMAPQWGTFPFQTPDVDGDGRLDLYLGGATWFRQKPDGSFEEMSNLPVSPQTMFDIDLDGRADFINSFNAGLPGGRVWLQVP